MGLNESIHFLNFTGVAGSLLDCGPANCSFPQGTCKAGVCECEVRPERRERNLAVDRYIDTGYFILSCLLESNGGRERCRGQNEKESQENVCVFTCVQICCSSSECIFVYFRMLSDLMGTTFM